MSHVARGTAPSRAGLKLGRLLGRRRRWELGCHAVDDDADHRPGVLPRALVRELGPRVGVPPSESVLACPRTHCAVMPCHRDRTTTGPASAFGVAASHGSLTLSTR
jgi:hypothetical protein